MAIALLVALSPAACRQEEQAVRGVAANAVNAEHKAQAYASALDEQRAELTKIPLPTKSMYVDVHEPSQWTNPLLSVGPEFVTLRIIVADANTSTVGEGTLLRPEAARRQEMQLRVSDLQSAIAAIPTSAWHYGRVIAVEESADAGPKDRSKMRRNVESVMRQLGDLGVVVEEWPSR